MEHCIIVCISLSVNFEGNTHAKTIINYHYPNGSNMFKVDDYILFPRTVLRYS